MTGRAKQQTLVLLFVLLAGFVLGGCFGGGGDDETSTSVAVTTSSGGDGGGGTGDTDAVVVDPTMEGLPQEFVDALQTRPIVVLFYVSGGADDANVLQSINRLKSSFREYEFLLYDYKDPDSYGTLAQVLGVEYLPRLVMIDAAGYRREARTGYVDEGSLNQMLVNLANE